MKKNNRTTHKPSTGKRVSAGTGSQGYKPWWLSMPPRPIEINRTNAFRMLDSVAMADLRKYLGNA